MKNPMLRDLGCWCVDSGELCYSRNLWVLLSYLLCIDIVLLSPFQIVIVNSLQGSISHSFPFYEVDAGISVPMARNVLSATSMRGWGVRRLS